ncbi:hypothetical protein [Rhodoferax sp.]|uniref:hypothetical protein n=1 Tax=Rhodoferax sp. TaxID=50421 RepID=UPI0026067360|nr:hypothetical protein [Rhodoferax sp.]MDD5478291.1 hypothetical protein [Rhodoferax sp.]
MDPMTIFAISGCLLTAGMVYVVLQVRFFGEKQAVSDQLLKAQTELAALKKTLAGYTQYRQALDAARQTLAEQLKPPVAKLVRPYTHVQAIEKALFKLDADANVVTTYEVEFSFSMDVSAAGLEVIDAANGVGLKLSRPALIGEPRLKTLNQKVFSAADVANTQPLFDYAHSKFEPLAKRYGLALGSEEALRAQCKLKALDVLRDALGKQAGVKQVPAIFVDFK